LRALNEADSFNGPSIVLAYAPASNDGKSRTAGTGISMEEETKLAINSGYWPLYRYNPKLEETGEKSFSLESPSIKKELKQFLQRQNQLSLFGKDAAQIDTSSGSLSVSGAFQKMEDNALQSSLDKLLSGLNGLSYKSDASLLILVGSDNGNADT